MMAAFNSRERTMEMWKELFEPIGLKMGDIYTSSIFAESIFELELADEY